MSQSVVSSCFYISGTICGLQIPVQLATGSVATMLNAETWRKMCFSCPSLSLLNEVESNYLHSVEMEGITHILGSVSVKLQLGRTEFAHSVLVVENLQQACHLGIDFFERYNCEIKFGKKLFQVGREKIPMLKKIEPVDSQVTMTVKPFKKTRERRKLALSFLPHVEIAKSQAEDPVIAPVLRQLKSGVAPSEEFVEKLGSTSRSLMNQYSLLEMVDGCLCLTSPKSQYQGSPRIILPVSLVNRVCQKFHVDPDGRHRDRFRTELTLRRQFWRPGLKALVASFVKTCHACNECVTVIDEVATQPKVQVLSAPSVESYPVPCSVPQNLEGREESPKTEPAMPASEMDRAGTLIGKGKVELSNPRRSRDKKRKLSVKRNTLDLEALKVKFLKRSRKTIQRTSGDPNIALVMH